MTKEKSSMLLLRLEQVLIVVAHLLLLKWIFYALYKGGTLNTASLLLHFLGMGVYGAALIRICAWLAKKRYLKTNGLEKLDA
jgi:apolipoprotein N-acyltransferase